MSISSFLSQALELYQSDTYNLKPVPLKNSQGNY